VFKISSLFRRKQYEIGGITQGFILPEIDSETAYKTNPWVFTCINIIGKKLSAVPLKIYQGDKEIEDTNIELFIRPNEFISFGEMLEKTIAWIELWGNAYWWMIRDSKGKPIKLYLLRSSLVSWQDDPINLYKKFYYNVGSEKIEIDPKDIIVFKNNNPFSDRVGVSTVSILGNTLTADNDIRILNKNLLSNGAVPKGVLYTEQSLTEAQIEKLRMLWEDSYKGANKAGKVAILTGGLQFQPIGLSPEDARFLEQRKLNREEIGAVFGVPPAFLGDYEHANYKIEDQRRIFYVDTIIPYARRIENKLNQSLMYEFGKDYWCQFDFSGVPEFQEDEEKKSRVLNEYVRNGVLTINEARERLGLEPVSYGDSWWVSLTLSPVSKSIKQETKKDIVKFINELTWEKKWKAFIQRTAPQENRLKKEISKLFEKQEKEVLDKLKENWGKGIKDYTNNIFDVEKWNEIFNKKIFPFLISFAQQGGDAILVDFNIDTSFNVNAPKVQNWISEKIRMSSEEINNTTRDNIRNAIQEALDNGETYNEMAKRIQNVFNEAKTSRAMTIARTEVTAINNFSMLEAVQQQDLNLHKKWLPALDEKTREWHAVMIDYGSIPLEDDFIVGGEAMSFPGDPRGSAENVINCRCVLDFVRKEEI